MPITDIQTTQPKLSRLGIIRLGVKTEKGYPKDVDHFVMKDAPLLRDAYGDAPQELQIYLPFATVDENFVAYHELWRATACLCRGDGEWIKDLLDPATGGVKVIRDSQVVVPFSDGGESYACGDRVACSGLKHDLYPRCDGCRPSGMLLFMVRDPNDPNQLVGNRLGYYQIRTHSFYNIKNLTGQLVYAAELSRKMGRDLRGIPMILRRTPKELSYVDQKGERRKKEYWLLELEFDLAWVQIANETMRNHALGGGGLSMGLLGHGDEESGEEIVEYVDSEVIVDDLPPFDDRLADLYAMEAPATWGLLHTMLSALVDRYSSSDCMNAVRVSQGVEVLGDVPTAEDWSAAVGYVAELLEVA